MSRFDMTNRVRMLRMHTASALPPKPRILTNLPYVIPAAMGAAPFLFKYIDPFSFSSTSLFFDKEQ